MSPPPDARYRSEKIAPVIAEVDTFASKSQMTEKR